MPKHIVKCAVCGESFDTNAIQAVKHGARRYAHLTCEPNNTELVPMAEPEDPALTSLKEYIHKLFGNNENFAMVNKQIKQFTDQGMSYSGIEKSLRYFYEIEHNNIDNANGAIGIVPYIYQNAKDYYYKIYIAQTVNQNKTFIQTVKEYIINRPRSQGTNIKIVHWGEDELDEIK